MKKLFSLIFIFFCTMAIKAQSGIDIAVIPVHFSPQIIDNSNNINMYGLKIGYFKWINDDQIRSVYLQAHGNSKSFSDQVYNSNFDQSSYKFCVNYDFTWILGEMDLKSNFYYRERIFLGYVVNNKKYTDTQLSSLNKNTNYFMGGYGYGFGYEYKVKPFVVIYVDLGANGEFNFTDFWKFSDFATAQVGSRIRFN